MKKHTISLFTILFSAILLVSCEKEYTGSIPAPANIQAAPLTKASLVRIAWDSIPNVAAYRVFYSADGTNFAPLTDALHTGCHYTHKPPKTGTHWYKVSAVYHDLESNPSPAASCLCLFPPATVTATKNGNEIVIEWNAVEHAQEYRIYRSYSAEGVFSKIGSVSSGQNIYDTQGLTAGATYYYKVTAVSGGIESDMSKPASCRY